MNSIRFKYSYLDGFRGVKHIDDDFGLLFKHSGSMIMDGCFIPLTALYLDKYMKIVGTQEMTPEPEEPYANRKYCLKDKKYSYVLEIKSGILDKLGWNIGDKLSIKNNTIEKLKVKSVPLSSISISKKDLDPTIWENNKLRKEVKDNILNNLYKKLEEYGYNEPTKWIEGIYLIGSETTNLYDDESDLDVQIVINVDKLEEFND